MRATVRLFATAAAVATAAMMAAGPATAVTGQTAATTPRWAPAAKATVHPGVKVSMGGVNCLAGFIFTDGTHAFVAVSGACSGPGEVANPKCDAGQDPVGLPVTIAGAKHKGTLVYSSVTAMELRGQKGDTNRCANNSLTLVRLNWRDIRRTNPSIPG